MSILTVVALVSERYFEIRVLSEYLSNGDVAWFWMTIAFLWGQGIVLGAATLHITQEETETRLHKVFKLLQATLVFLTCPLLYIVWYIWITAQAMRKGDMVFEEKYDCTRRMRQLQAVAENAPQMLLQLYIVIFRSIEQGKPRTRAMKK